jgi:hypothetical protein
LDREHRGVASKARGASSAAAVPDRRHVAQAATANVAGNDAAVGRVVQAVAVLKVATVRDVAPADREHRGAVVSAALRDQVLTAGSVVASAVAALVLRLAVDSVALAAKLAIAVAATITRTGAVAEIAAAMSVVLAVTMGRVAEIGRAAREAIGRRNCIACK